MTTTTLDPAAAVESALSEVRDRLRDLADNASDEQLLDELRSLLRRAGGKIRRATKRTEEAAKPEPGGQSTPKPAAAPKPAPPPPPPPARTAGPVTRDARPVGKREVPAAKPAEAKPTLPVRTPAVAAKPADLRVSAPVAARRAADPTPGQGRPVPAPAPKPAPPPPPPPARRLPRWLLAVVLVLAVVIVGLVNTAACVAVASIGAIYTGARLGWRALRHLRRRPT